MNLQHPANKDYTLISATDAQLDGAVWRALAPLLPADHHVVFHAAEAQSIREPEGLAQLVAQHRAGGHSLIAVVPEALLDAFEEGFPVVPTLPEAEDFLEMEDIERQLGL
jgi:hypothetical protein